MMTSRTSPQAPRGSEDQNISLQAPMGIPAKPQMSGPSPSPYGASTTKRCPSRAKASSNETPTPSTWNCPSTSTAPQSWPRPSRRWPAKTGRNASPSTRPCSCSSSDQLFLSFHLGLDLVQVVDPPLQLLDLRLKLANTVEPCDRRGLALEIPSQSVKLEPQPSHVKGSVFFAQLRYVLGFPFVNG
jgi:hypothetical protein